MRRIVAVVVAAIALGGVTACGQNEVESGAKKAGDKAAQGAKDAKKGAEKAAKKAQETGKDLGY
jgi:hypothetical protein